MIPSRITGFRVGAVLVWLVLALSMHGQSYRSKVSGIVTDQSGGVVVGATVTLSNLNTGIKVVRKSSETGLFVFDLVDPGVYSVTAEATGFSKFVQEKITVQTRDDITVNASLRPGTIAESVTVTGDAVAVQFNSSSRDLTIDTKLAEEIPRFDRNPFKLTLLAPSADADVTAALIRRRP